MANYRDITNLVDEFGDLMPSEWRAFADGLSDDERREMSKSFRFQAEWTARAAAYLTARSGRADNAVAHRRAVNASTRTATKVRRALNVSPPKNAVSF